MTNDIALSIFLSAGFGLTALYVSIERRHKPTWKSGVILLLACAEITLAHALQSYSVELTAKILWYKLAQVGFTISPTAFLVLAMQYAQPQRKISSRTLFALSFFPILFAVLILTNERHGLIWNPALTAFVVNSDIFLTQGEAGIGHWLFVVYSYFVIGLGCYFLVQFTVRSRGIYKRQAWGIVSAAIFALLGAALDIFHLSPYTPFATTGLGLAIGTILMTFILASVQRRDLMSIARGTIINSVSDAIIVIDEYSRIVTLNPAAESLLEKQTSEEVGKPLEAISPMLNLSLSQGVTSYGKSVEIPTCSGTRMLDLRVSDIADWRGHVISHVIVLRDITERKQVEETLTKRATELATVEEIGTAASTLMDTDALLQKAVDLTKQRFNLYHAHIYLLSEDGQSLVLTSGADQIGRQMAAHGRSLLMNQEQSLVARAARTRQGVVINNVSQAPDFLPNPFLPETRSEMAIPLIFREQVLGVLDVQSEQVDRFSENDINIMSTLAAQIAIALQNARQYQQLRATAADLAGFQNAINEGAIVAIIGMDGKIEFVNDNFVSISHYARVELIGQNEQIISMACYPRDRANNLWETATAGHTWRGEICNHTKDGSPYWLDTTVSPIFDEQGEPINYVWICFDITERKRAEEALQMFQYTVDRASDAVQWLNRDAGFEYVNDQACRSLGYSREELMRLHLWDIDPIYPKERWYKNWENYQINRQGGSEYIETVHRRKDGGFFPVEVSSKHLWFGDQELHVAVIHDISNRKRAENLIRTLNGAALAMQQATTPDQTFAAVSGELKKINFSCAIFAVDDDNDQLVLQHYTFTNQAIKLVETITGLTAKNYTISISTVNAFSRCLREKKALFLENLVDTAKQSIPNHLSTLAEAVIKGLGLSKSIIAPLIIEEQAIGLFTVQSDDLQESDEPAITAFANQLAAAWRQSQLFEQAKHDLMARTIAEARVIQMNEGLEQRVIERTAQLEAANKELEAFAYSVSHDLRAPLRAIDGYTRILVEDYEPILDAEGKRVCSVVQDEARRMGELIDDLLAFSRLSRTEMQTSQVNMKAMVKSVFQELASPEDQKRIDFHIGNLPSVHADPSLIRQVWINLIANAIKFSSKRDRSEIRITSEQTEKEVVFCVKDNGVGFDSRYINKLFGVFQRLHSEKEFPGTGVGLAIVQRIVHRHGGRVWAESESGQGAAFFFALPRKVTEHEST